MEVHDKGMMGAHDKIKKTVRVMNKQKLGIVFVARLTQSKKRERTFRRNGVETEME